MKFVKTHETNCFYCKAKYDDSPVFLVIDRDKLARDQAAEDKKMKMFNDMKDDQFVEILHRLP